jgi:uncharacterized membrane protein YhaH (DUF805 family)
MNFQQAVQSCIRRYVDFNGRSARSEFWYFYLAIMAAYVAFTVLQTILTLIMGGPNALTVILALVFYLAMLGVMLPYIAVSIRRLHDTNRSAWFLLIGLIPLVGGILLIVWFATVGTVGENRFGADPLGGGGATPAKPDTAWAS